MVGNLYFIPNLFCIQLYILMGMRKLNGTFSRTLIYSDGLPTGMVTVVLQGYGIVQLPGPWAATWNAPSP